MILKDSLKIGRPTKIVCFGSFLEKIFMNWYYLFPNVIISHTGLKYAGYLSYEFGIIVRMIKDWLSITGEQTTYYLPIG